MFTKENFEWVSINHILPNTREQTAQQNNLSYLFYSTKFYCFFAATQFKSSLCEDEHPPISQPGNQLLLHPFVRTFDTS